MRKKISGVIVAFIVASQLFGCGGASKKFTTMHSDVKFGMSKDEVYTIESEAGFDTEFLEDTEIYGEYGRVRISGKIAGINDAVIMYCFDEDGLYKASYFLRDDYESNYKDLDSEFSTISKGLTQNYGKPTYSSEKQTAFRLKEYKSLTNIDGLSRSEEENEHCKKINELSRQVGEYSGTYSKVPMWEQWILKQDDGTIVLIDHYVIDSHISEESIFNHYIWYTNLGEDALDLATIENVSKQMDNDL